MESMCVSGPQSAPQGHQGHQGRQAHQGWTRRSHPLQPNCNPYSHPLLPNCRSWLGGHQGREPETMVTRAKPSLRYGCLYRCIHPPWVSPSLLHTKPETQMKDTIDFKTPRHEVCSDPASQWSGPARRGCSSDSGSEDTSGSSASAELGLFSPTDARASVSEVDSDDHPSTASLVSNPSVTKLSVAATPHKTPASPQPSRSGPFLSPSVERPSCPPCPWLCLPWPMRLSPKWKLVRARLSRSHV